MNTTYFILILLSAFILGAVIANPQARARFLSKGLQRIKRGDV